MGIRMALGAQAGSVLWLVLREAILLVLIGIAAGIPLVFIAARLIEGLLFGVAPADPAALAGTALLMLFIAAAAAWLPGQASLPGKPGYCTAPRVALPVLTCQPAIVPLPHVVRGTRAVSGRS